MSQRLGGIRLVLTTVAAHVTMLPALAKDVDYAETSASVEEISVARVAGARTTSTCAAPAGAVTSFELASGIALYIGFRWGETRREKRGFGENERIHARGR